MGKDMINGLHTDRYELAMALAYWREGRAEEPTAFDYFFRRCPFGGSYVGFAGLETLLEAFRAFTRALSDDDFKAVKDELTNKGVRFIPSAEIREEAVS